MRTLFFKYSSFSNLRNFYFFINSNEDRHGSEADVRNLVNMFKELRYDIQETWTDLDETELQNKLGTLMSGLNSEEDGCLLFFVMCHGDAKNLYLKNSKIERVEFYNLLVKNDGARDIPKIIFYNNCRGIVESIFSLSFLFIYK